MADQNDIIGDQSSSGSTKGDDNGSSSAPLPAKKVKTPAQIAREKARRKKRKEKLKARQKIANKTLSADQNVAETPVLSDEISIDNAVDTDPTAGNEFDENEETENNTDTNEQQVQNDWKLIETTEEDEQNSILHSLPMTAGEVIKPDNDIAQPEVVDQSEKAVVQPEIVEQPEKAVVQPEVSDQSEEFLIKPEKEEVVLQPEIEEKAEEVVAQPVVTDQPADFVEQKEVEEKPEVVVSEPEIEEEADEVVTEPDAGVQTENVIANPLAAFEVAEEPSEEVVEKPEIAADDGNEAIEDEVVKDSSQETPSLEEDEDLLAEADPGKNGWFGKVLDFFTAKKSLNSLELPSARAKVIEDQESTIIEEQKLTPEDQAMEELGDVALADDSESSSKIAKYIGAAVRYLLGGLLVIGLMVGAFWIGSQLKVLEWFNFTNNSGPKIEITDPVLAKRNGFLTLVIVGANNGNKRDELLPHFKALFLFAKVKGVYLINSQNGVTSVSYYGLGSDLEYYTNRFIYYVDFLGQLKALYTVDVFAVLDNAVNRQEELNKFLAKTKEIYQTGVNVYQELGTQLADFKVAYNDLNTQKTTLETAFFNNLELGFGEKANVLLQQFIEVNQKQIELKAKVGALNQLITQYQKVMQLLAKRIEAIEKNQDALIEGVRVIDIPGSNIDFVIKTGSN